MLKPKCKKCGGKSFWKVRRGKLKCKNCRYEFKFKIGKINLSLREWKALLKWFLRCQSINVIVEETRKESKRGFGTSKQPIFGILSLVAFAPLVKFGQPLVMIRKLTIFTAHY